MKIEKKAEEEKIEDSSDVKIPPPSPVPRSTPRQEQLEKQIAQLSTEIVAIKVLITHKRAKPTPRG